MYSCIKKVHLFTYAADPRRWSREDVTRWLQWTSEAFNLGSVRPDRFQMNGKALCLMTMDMFLYRVPEGGNILYQDFQRRLRNAVAMQTQLIRSDYFGLQTKVSSTGSDLQFGVRCMNWATRMGLEDKNVERLISWGCVVVRECCQGGR